MPADAVQPRRTLSLGSSRASRVGSLLTCGGTLSASEAHSLRSPVFPVVSRTTWHESGTSAWDADQRNMGV